MVRGATNANLYQFFTGRTMGPYGSTYNPSVKDNVLTLPELFGVDRQAATYTHPTTGGQVRVPSMAVDAGAQFSVMKDNLKANWPSMLSTAIVTPIAFKLGKRVLSKSGVTRSLNRGFEMIGMKELKA